MTDELVILEIDDPRWDAAANRVLDPHSSRPFLRAQGHTFGRRPVLAVLEGEDWSARYPLELTAVGADRWLARTPDYGGLWIEAADPESAARSCRTRLDRALMEIGVVSEVFVFSVWAPHRDMVAEIWNADAHREVRVVALEDLASPASISKGRRSDLSRARRDQTPSWTPLDEAGAAEFADLYVQHAARVEAEDRWRLGPDYFATLAGEPDLGAHLSWSRGDSGGAACLLLETSERASYALGVRWGEAPGATTLALWTACSELRAAGARELLLGGGLTDSEADPLLAFKRSWGGTASPLYVGGRVFDPGAHDRLVGEGRARPLPAGAVAP